MLMILFNSLFNERTGKIPKLVQRALEKVNVGNLTRKSKDKITGLDLKLVNVPTPKVI